MPRVQFAVKPRSRRALLLAALLALGAGARSAWLAGRRASRPARPAPRVVRIGYAVEAPYAFLDPEGTVVGESQASAGLIAQRLGWQIEWVQTEFDLLIPDLLEGRFDLIDAGLFVTPQRAREVRFAVPRLRVSPALLVPRGNPKGLHTWEGMKAQPDLRLAVVGGSVEEAHLQALGVPRVLSVPDARAGAAAVLARLVDALALSLPTVRLLAGRQAGLEAVRVDDADGVSYVAAAFRPDEADLLRAWNGAQAEVVGTAQQLAAIAPFGFTRDDVIVPVSAALTR